MLEALGRLTKSSKRVTTELDWTLGALGDFLVLLMAILTVPMEALWAAFTPVSNLLLIPTSLNSSM